MRQAPPRSSSIQDHFRPGGTVWVRGCWWRWRGMPALFSSSLISCCNLASHRLDGFRPPGSWIACTWGGLGWLLESILEGNPASSPSPQWPVTFLKAVEGSVSEDLNQLSNNFIFFFASKSSPGTWLLPIGAFWGSNSLPLFPRYKPNQGIAGCCCNWVICEGSSVFTLWPAQKDGPWGAGGALTRVLQTARPFYWGHYFTWAANMAWLPKIRGSLPSPPSSLWMLCAEWSCPGHGLGWEAKIWSTS